MAKGFKKLLTLTGIVAAAAGLYCYLNEEDTDGKKKGENLMNTVRRYIPLNTNAPAEQTKASEAEETDDEEFFEEEETEAEETQETAEETADEEVFVQEETVEEKFVPLSETVKNEESGVEVDSEDFFVSE